MAESFRRALARLPMINQPRQPHFYSASTRRRLPLSETPFPLFVPFFTVSLSPLSLSFVFCLNFFTQQRFGWNVEKRLQEDGSYRTIASVERVEFVRPIDSIFPFKANRSRNFHFLRTYYTLPTNLLSSRIQRTRALPSSKR